MIVFKNQDCVQAMRELEAESIDCLVTDCPYRIVSGGDSKNLFDGLRRMSGPVSHTSTLTRQGKIFKHNDIAFADWLPEVYRVLKDGTHAYIMVNARNLKSLQIAAEQSGFKFVNLLVWDKGNVLPNKYYMNAYELILMLRKGKARNINDMGAKNILRIPSMRGNRIHPTEKPVELMRVLVENSTNKGEVVLDPFAGSGATLVACQQLERSAIGYEIDKGYYDLARLRIAAKEE